MPAKPGFKTSEFWMAVAVIIGMAGLLFAAIHWHNMTLAVLAVSGAVLKRIAYTISRTFAKLIPGAGQWLLGRVWAKIQKDSTMTTLNTAVGTPAAPSLPTITASAEVVALASKIFPSNQTNAGNAALAIELAAKVGLPLLFNWVNSVPALKAYLPAIQAGENMVTAQL